MDHRNIQGRIALELVKIRRQISEMKSGEGMGTHADHRGTYMDYRSASGTEFATGQVEYSYNSIPEPDLEGQLHERVIELGLTNNELLQELAEKRRKEAELKTEFTAREAELKQIISTLEQEVDVQQELRTKLNLAEKSNAELLAKLAHVEESKVKLTTKLVQAENDLADNTSANKEVLTRIKALEKDNSKLLKCNQDLLNEITGLRQEEDALRKQTEYNEIDFKQKIGETVAENVKLKLQVSEFKKVVQELKRKVSHQETRMKERLNHLKRANSELRQEIMSRMQTGEHVIQTAGYEDLDEAVIEMTIDGIILGWNNSAQILCGYGADEVKGFPFSILVPRKSYDDFQKVIKQIKDGADNLAIETVFVKKDGEQLKVLVTSTAITDDKGMLIGITSMANQL